MPNLTSNLPFHWPNGRMPVHVVDFLDYALHDETHPNLDADMSQQIIEEFGGWATWKKVGPIHLTGEALHNKLHEWADRLRLPPHGELVVVLFEVAPGTPTSAMNAWRTDPFAVAVANAWQEWVQHLFMKAQILV